MSSNLIPALRCWEPAGWRNINYRSSAAASRPLSPEKGRGAVVVYAGAPQRALLGDGRNTNVVFIFRPAPDPSRQMGSPCRGRVLPAPSALDSLRPLCADGAPKVAA